MFATSRRLQASAAYQQALAVIKQDLKQAMLAKNKVQKNTIRSVLSTIKNSEIDGAKQTEYDLYKVFGKMLKQRSDSEALYKAQKREDLASVEAEESQIIRKYLEALPLATEEEIAQKLEEWLTQLHAEAGASVSKSDILRKITPELAQEWNTVASSIRSKIPALYQKIWGA